MDIFLKLASLKIEFTRFPFTYKDNACLPLPNDMLGKHYKLQSAYFVVIYLAPSLDELVFMPRTI